LVSFTIKFGIFSERETIIILFGNKPWYWIPPNVHGKYSSGRMSFQDGLHVTDGEQTGY
jgi:hypothetical protein